ncbi:unnamed protein product [Penicillium nalgiovense]|uniref:C2H2-type domain-containing protein n=1 Tax=Penicillium nalgiovense TaxID=60175 RepID=A0A9W4MZ74_PENNA|nr:unnamed protein product [Penicillium nalgiovense]CAG8002625.1 unnamed protein product [Penicillium nalgiovense]CAG8031256.1 unnamed protein product [Penicillium nalgiovense]CAG8090392.1 unnamed protein product [Penicillium nalgiovense]CAG8092635.1 unnamed protein product [Penicillium nalgiovense]
MRLGPGDLLEYNAEYKVLICRDCHYAIQKNALASHLLRHKIYREERLRLLSTIHQLDIVEPGDLLIPSPNTRPVDALPIVSGYSCTMTGCGHLCASSKRMRRHWSDVHSVSGPNDFASYARPVKLQTFFRGTKLKYFEVSVASTAAESPDFDEGGRHDRKDAGVTEVPSLTQPSSLSESSPVVDLETLVYFHHLMITTCLTLPRIEDSPPASQYWGKCFVSLAMRQRWLMCGLLAISAYHSATLEDERTAQQKHSLCPPRISKKRKKIAVQIRSIISCARWTLTGSATNQETVLGPTTALSRLQSLLCDVRDFSELGNSLAIQQSKGNDLETSLGLNSPRVTATAPTVLLNRLQMLPYRMAEIFGKPDHEQDAPAILLSIAALLECCSSLFEPNGSLAEDLSGTWQGISAWLNKTTDHFDYMVSHLNPAALIVLAHWAAILVKRTEVYECWFIHGFSRAIVLLIHEHFSTDDAVRGLVEGLLG